MKRQWIYPVVCFALAFGLLIYMLRIARDYI